MSNLIHVQVVGESIMLQPGDALAVDKLDPTKAHMFSPHPEHKDAITPLKAVHFKKGDELHLATDLIKAFTNNIVKLDGSEPLLNLHLDDGGDASGQDETGTHGGDASGQDETGTDGGDASGQDETGTDGGDASGQDETGTDGGDASGQDETGTDGGDNSPIIQSNGLNAPGRNRNRGNSRV